jgi:hypothetical protein
MEEQQTQSTPASKLSAPATRNGGGPVLGDLIRRFRSKAGYVQRQLYYSRLRRASISKREFLIDLRKALDAGTGYAAGKGKSPQH